MGASGLGLLPSLTLVTVNATMWFDSLLPFMKAEKHECCTECGKNAVLRWYRVTALHLPKAEHWHCNACNDVMEDIQVRSKVREKKKNE